ncbi:APC family permease [soil metagenome]
MKHQQYEKNSLSLIGSIALGTGVMIGAGIFALLGQVAELSGQWFPIAFLLGAVISGFSAYTYIKMSNAYPSAGGIAMILKKAYGPTTITAWAAMLMAFSMVINESLVARTFGTYTLRLFEVDNQKIWVPILGVLLIVAAFLVNLAGNKFIGKSSMIMAAVKIGGIAIFAIGGIWATGFSIDQVLPEGAFENRPVDYLGALALSILAFKGFTTITNSGGEIKNPNKNVGRSIVISLLICTLVYLLVSVAVTANLSIPDIIKAKDYSLAEAAKPAFGKYGVWFTVGIAIIATISGIIASIFAVSRMTAMLTDMKLIPSASFGMPGNVQQHMLVYIAIIAIVLTVTFDLSRIASLGAIYYLVMDVVIHWGVFKNLRKDIGANGSILVTAMVLDAVVLGAFLWVKVTTDWLVVLIAAISMLLIYAGEWCFLSKVDDAADDKMTADGVD